MWREECRDVVRAVRLTEVVGGDVVVAKDDWEDGQPVVVEVRPKKTSLENGK